MCPVCIAHAAQVALGTASTGGLIAVVLKELRDLYGATRVSMKTPAKEREMEHLNVVSQAEWLNARRKLLAKEKEFTRQRDALSAARRELPMVKIEKEYVF